MMYFEMSSLTNDAGKRWRSMYANYIIKHIYAFFKPQSGRYINNIYKYTGYLHLGTIIFNKGSNM